ncbi:MAG: sodium/glutamate symporter, partial [Eubacterium sp.]|nr:sodium/glutamate symporter [Eubacterium sp.]
MIFCILLVFCILASGCGKSSSSLKIGTGNEGGTYNSYGNALSVCLSEKMKNTEVSAVTTNGSASNIRLLNEGLVQFAIVQNDTLRDAFEGNGSFSAEGPAKDVRALAGLYMEVCQIVVPAGSDIRTVSDLNGKSISVGVPESGVVANTFQILEAYGISADMINPLYLSFTESAEAMMNGQIDAFFCTASPSVSVLHDLASSMDIRLLSLDERAISQMKIQNDCLSRTVIPAGTYAGQDEDILTVGTKAVLVSNASLDNNVVSVVLETLFENADSLQEITNDYLPLDPSYAAEDISVPFHDGTAGFYKDYGIDIPVFTETPAGDGERPVIALDMFQTIALAVVALLLGAFLKLKIPFLNKFCIPAPVVGGLIFAIAFYILYMAGIAEFTFDETLRTVCMVIFFASVGFQANMKVIKSGGKALLILVGLVFVLIVLQNFVATGLSSVLGIDPLIGLCTGSIPMVGGHGTAGAFGPLLEDMNVQGATTLSTAAATFGLIAGSLMGGPLANHLIKKKDLLKTAVAPDSTLIEEEEQKHRRQVSKYAPAAYQLIVAIGIGTIVSLLLSATGLTFPIYIGALIVGAIFRNVVELTGKFHVYMGEINDIGGICLELFLGIAMITLKLWQLTSLALPLVILLLGQTVLMFLFARFVVFNAMGRDYDAAVITAGTCGFGMGATPNAMANMAAVTKKYAPSIKAFLLVPLVGSMFTDFLNSLTIT